MTAPNAPGTPDPPPHLRVEMLSCPRFLSGAREMVASLARRLGFDEIAASQVALAVDEALANVIRHGYERREDQPIWMTIWQIDERSSPVAPPFPEPAGLRIVIEDLGRQTEPEQIKGRDLEDIRPGGLGVHIIREVMDEAVYEKRAGGGMRLTLVKRLSRGKDGRSDDSCAEGCAGECAPPPTIETPSAPPSGTAKGRGNVHG